MRYVWLIVIAICLFCIAFAGVAAADLPTETTPPSISGADPPQVGDVLTETPAVWAGSPTEIQVQWEDCAPGSVTTETCTPIAGATGTTYTVAASDVGFSLLVQETASNADGSEGAFSEDTEVVLVAGTTPAVQTVPKLSGLLEIGGTLMVSTGSWSGTPKPSYSYTWYRCPGGGPCDVIAGATGPSLTLTSLERNDGIQVLVTATNALGTASSYARAYGRPVESAGGVGGLTNLATAERQVRQAAGLGVSLASLLKHGGYTVSFLFQLPTAFQVDRLQVSWTAVPSPGARPVRVAWLSQSAVDNPFAPGPPKSITARLKVKLTAQGRTLLEHDSHLVVQISSIFQQVFACQTGNCAIPPAFNGFYPVEFTSSRSL